ncbi:cysteine desulfurase family protein [Tunturiibacter gelidoferens]|uniref:Cysteine desulfurase n=1 Tax=Tunturiibacter gelidiferens TaxID=3069689 RepID=A0ACC5NU44_9BACT|nr:cysteine desulfurase family protein [Edaphobacter lichenicola]MBB5337974.1 cysteine desulfurase [Edaphobacter lichenicola]
MRRIYMDANATTPLLPEVFEAMRPFFLEHYGNASSIHQQGQFARAAVDHARDQIASLLHCRTSEIVFTSGGTESDNLALFGTLERTAEPAHLITTSIEHDAILRAAESLEKKNIEVTFLPSTPQGLIEPAALQAALRPNTKLVSVMFANNETGVIQPIAELAAIAHAAGALFHTDAVQAVGRLPLDLSPKGALKDVDLLTLSGHKIYAPKGIGVLFVRRSVRLAPMLHGGSHERQRRAGTENVAGIVAIGKAAELARAWLATTSATTAGIANLDSSTTPGAPSFAPFAKGGLSPTPTSAPANESGAPHLNSEMWASGERPTAPAPPNYADSPTHLAALRDRLEQGILSQVEECGINGAGAPRVSNTTSLYFDHIEAEALVIALDLKGLSVSGGSACQSGATEPSHVLTAMGLSPARARASVRFSLSRLTTAEEIDQVLTLIPTAVARLRDLSPTWRKAPALIPA